MFKKLFNWFKNEEENKPQETEFNQEDEVLYENSVENDNNEEQIESLEEKNEDYEIKQSLENEEEIQESDLQEIDDESDDKITEENIDEVEEEKLETIEETTTQEKDEILIEEEIFEEDQKEAELEIEEQIEEKCSDETNSETEENISEVIVDDNNEEKMDEEVTDDIAYEQDTQGDVIDEKEIQEEKLEEKEEIVPVQKGFFARLKEGLLKTTKNLTDKINDMLEGYDSITEEVYEELEEILIMADVGFETTMYIVDKLRENIKSKSIREIDDVKQEIRNIVTEILDEHDSSMNLSENTIITVVGVNGVGKTTTIGKMASKYRNQGRNVILAAADTFRAAAAEQLEIWAQRADVDIVKHKEGADPSAVIFDGIKAAKARKKDILICDTAGRLHNKKNLMQELGKVFKIIDREYPEATKEVLLVIDATTGQNAINQAKIFKEVAPLTGIILTKLDGTAKGGVVLAIIKELGLPVKFIGVGEKIDDLQEFNSKDFANALFEK